MARTNLKLGLIVGLLLSIAIVATNVLVPFIWGHSTPDNDVSEGIGWLILIGIVCFVGFTRVRRSASVRDAAIAGSVIAFVAFGIAMITFLVIDDVFVAIVSQQPEKIWLFERSGYPDMKSYLLHTNLRAIWTVLPIITLVGGLCGCVGGYLNSILRRVRGRGAIR